MNRQILFECAQNENKSQPVYFLFKEGKFSTDKQIEISVFVVTEQKYFH